MSALNRLIGGNSPLSKHFSSLQSAQSSLLSGKRGSAGNGQRNVADAAVLLHLSEQSRSSEAAARSARLNDSVLRIAEGTLGVVSDVTSRLEELAAQSANGVLNDSQRAAVNAEYTALREEVQRITATTEFNGSKLFSGEYQVSFGSEPYTLPNISSDALGIPKSIATAELALSALDPLKEARTTVSGALGDIGSSSARLNSVRESSENLATELKVAGARISDEGFAEALTEQVSSSISLEASVSLAASANVSAEVALGLL